jgi:hypothetical protein
MKLFCFAATLIVLTAGCTSASSPTADQTVDNNSYILHSTAAVPPANPASRPPRLTVGTSFPDTQLILPWFLDDIINFVNYH